MKTLSQYITESKGFDPSQIDFRKFIVYRTKFNLENPVNNIVAAQRYLEEDNMTTYLLDELHYLKRDDIAEKIEAIFWNLTNTIKGEIVLVAKESIDKKELNVISEWVSGQCSDGLGEGFEQQGFASYVDEYDEDVMASFDWKTNDYKFEEVKNYRYR